MRLSDAQLMFVTLVFVAAVALGMLVLRLQPRGAVPATIMRGGAWLLWAVGLAALAALSLAQFTGRLGPEHFWFREPAFYIAIATLLFAGVWWLRRPAPVWLRYGAPAVAITLAVLAVLVSRLDGRSMPMSVSMPTRQVAAPELVYIDAAGARRRLEEFTGRVVLVNFWATWCTPCRREMPLLSAAQREHREQGLVVLYVSLEEPEVLEPFLAENRFDGEFGRLAHAAEFYGAGQFYPLSYLISRDGRVAYRWSGRPREDWLDARIRDLLR